MFFARVGTILAWIGFVLGAMQIAAGIYFGSQLPSDPEAMAEAQAWLERRYGATSGEMVDRGFWIVLGSVVLGTLAKIAKRK